MMSYKQFVKVTISYFEIPTRGLTLINKSGYLFAVFNAEEAMNVV